VKAFQLWSGGLDCILKGGRKTNPRVFESRPPTHLVFSGGLITSETTPSSWMHRQRWPSLGCVTRGWGGGGVGGTRIFRSSSHSPFHRPEILISSLLIIFPLTILFNLLAPSYSTCPVPGLPFLYFSRFSTYRFPLLVTALPRSSRFSFSLFFSSSFLQFLFPFKRHQDYWVKHGWTSICWWSTLPYLFNILCRRTSKKGEFGCFSAFLHYTSQYISL